MPTGSLHLEDVVIQRDEIIFNQILNVIFRDL